MKKMAEIFDLRTYMDALRAKNLIADIKTEVDWDIELGSVLRTVEKQKNQAALFHKVKDRTFRVCGGMLSNMDCVAVALGCEKADVTDVLGKALENPVKPRIVADGPCHENVWTGDEVDLDKLPIPHSAPKDGGRFITGGVVVSKELHGDRHNLSFQRMQVKGKQKLGICINEWRHLKEFLTEAEKEDKGLPIAVVCGGDPVLYIGAGLRYDGSELEVAGAIRGKPIDVVKCITSDIYVPATAEFVIEGVIEPEVREPEGPLGEFTGMYGEPWESPVLHVTAITCRNDAIYQTINGASDEHITLGNVIPREPLLKKFTTYVSSGVVNVHIPPYGCGFLALVQLKKSNPGEPKNVALAAMMTYVNIKNVIVVDEDVDIYDAADVMWAVTNRVIPSRDIFYVPNAQGHEFDPGSDERGCQTKMGIDATQPEHSRTGERVRYAVADLARYL